MTTAAPALWLFGSLASALALSACEGSCSKRGASSGTAAAPSASIRADEPPDANPFARKFPFETAIIEITNRSSESVTVLHVKRDRVRSEAIKGMFANGTYSIFEGTREERVLPRERKVIVFGTPEGHLLAAYGKLAPEERARVRESITRIGPDLPFYSEHRYAPATARDFFGVRASCYRLTSRLLGDAGDRCFLRGQMLSMHATNPIDDRPVDIEVSAAKIGVPIDDASFVVPADFVREPSATDDTMAELYAKLLARMTKKSFSLDELDRYAP